MAVAVRALMVCAIIAAAPLHAQSGVAASTQWKPAQPTYTPPANPYVYVDPWLLRQALRPKDERTPTQRCIDVETGRLGGEVSDLARAAISLTCSQR